MKNEIIAGYQFGVRGELKPLTEEGFIRFLTTKNFKDKIVDLNTHKFLNGKDVEYDKMKEKLPAVAFAGWFNGGKRKQSEIISTSGFLLVDIDEGENSHLSQTDIQERLDILKKQPSVYYADWSSSGMGIHCLMRIPKYTGTAKEIQDQFRHAFRVIARDFREDWDTIIDSSVNGVQSLKFVGKNEDPYINTDAKEYNIPEYVPIVRITNNTDRANNFSRANKFYDTLMERGTYNEEGDLEVYENTDERHGWIVRLCASMFRNFDLTQEEFERILLPLAQHPTSISHDTKQRRITQQEIKRIISWCFDVNWETDEATYTPDENEKHDLPWESTEYNFEA